MEKPFGGSERERKSGNKHKEKGERRQKMGETDRNTTAEELQKHSHPLNVKSTYIYSIANGQVAPTKVNVQDVQPIGSTQSDTFAAMLSDAFHSKIERKVKTMQEMKKVVIVNGKVIFDIETLFAGLLVVGQQRGVEVTHIFQYELIRVIDEFGCLRKGDKTVLVKCLGVPVNSAPAPDTVLVDASQLLYHVVWPVAGTAGDIALNSGVRLSHYPPEARKIVLFDRYYVHEPKEATAATNTATDRQQPATTVSRAPSPSTNDALKGSISEAATGRRSIVTSAVSVGMSIKMGLLHHLCQMHRQRHGGF